MVSKKAFKGMLTGVALAGVAACSTINVKTDAARDMSLAGCHSYTFAPEHVANADQPAAYGNPLNAERLRVAIQNNLAAKGLRPAVDRGPGDCVIGYALGSRQVFDDYYGGLGLGWGFGGGWRGGYGRFGGGWGYDGPWVDSETRIAVDVFDGASHKPIWHASASQTTSELSGPRAEEKINAATAAIFGKWPGGMPAAARTTT